MRTGNLGVIIFLLSMVLTIDSSQTQSFAQESDSSKVRTYGDEPSRQTRSETDESDLEKLKQTVADLSEMVRLQQETIEQLQERQKKSDKEKPQS